MRNCNCVLPVLLTLQLKAIHLGLLNSYKQLEGSFNGLKQERVRAQDRPGKRSSQPAVTTTCQRRNPQLLPVVLNPHVA
jgi:hypothetical protein